VNIKRPVAALAELAIADDVDPDLRLLPDDFLDRLLEARLVGGLVVGLAVLDCVQELDRCGGLTKLPTWVVRMRSALAAISCLTDTRRRITDDRSSGRNHRSSVVSSLSI
jgi:hypothetical protein